MSDRVRMKASVYIEYDAHQEGGADDSGDISSIMKTLFMDQRPYVSVKIEPVTIQAKEVDP